MRSSRTEERRNNLTDWVDSDFATDPDTRKSMTGYLFSLNGGAVSWRSSRQGGVTLSSAEAEFVAASQAGQEAVDVQSICERCCGVSISDKSALAPQKYGKIMPLVL